MLDATNPLKYFYLFPTKCGHILLVLNTICLWWFVPLFYDCNQLSSWPMFRVGWKKFFYVSYFDIQIRFVPCQVFLFWLEFKDAWTRNMRQSMPGCNLLLLRVSNANATDLKFSLGHFIFLRGRRFTSDFLDGWSLEDTCGY